MKYSAEAVLVMNNRSDRDMLPFANAARRGGVKVGMQV